MKPNDRTIVYSRPQARTVASDSIMYLETALLVLPLAAELPVLASPVRLCLSRNSSNRSRGVDKLAAAP